MRFPQFLKDNGTIGFVAPSFGCATEPYYSLFNNAQKRFTDMGYKLSVGPNCYVEKGIGISNDPKLCGIELNESYVSSDNDVIISCGGGELMCETVNYIDFDAIAKANPKWYMGYSDNTNFTFLSATLADTAAIYGPCVSDFGMIEWHESIEDAFDLLCGRKLTFKGYSGWEYEGLKDESNPLLPYNITEESVITTYPTGSISMEGRLIGGCMDCLVNLTGTKYDRVREFTEKYADDGILWFIEACDLNMMGIRRALWQMKNAGWFENVSGFIVGRPLHIREDMMGLDHIRAVTDILSEFNVPILLDADIGHHAPMMPIITGAMASVKADVNEYSIEMRLE